MGKLGDVGDVGNGLVDRGEAGSPRDRTSHVEDTSD